jgi:hypothetical protein
MYVMKSKKSLVMKMLMSSTGTGKLVSRLPRCLFTGKLQSSFDSGNFYS